MTNKYVRLLPLLFIFVFTACSTPPLMPPIPFGKKVKKEYFTNGQVRSEFIMSDNTGQNGVLKKYGFDGKITSVAHIKNGVRNGVETWYDKKGRILMRVPYVNGRKHGVQEAYYPNGDIMISYTYKNGIKDGPAVAYNKDGSVYERVTYRHGKRIN